MVKHFCAERGAQWPTTLKKLSLRHPSQDSWPTTKEEAIHFVTWMFDVQLLINELEFFSVHGFYPWLEKTHLPLRVMNTRRLELPLPVAQFLAGNSPVESLDLSQTWYDWSDELEKFPERLPQAAVTEVAVLIPDLEGYEVALKKFLGQVPNVKTLVLNWATNARISAEIIYILFQQCPLLHTLDVAAMSKHNDWDSKDIRRDLDNKNWSVGMRAMYLNGTLIWSHGA
ncbi:hypothetical protein BDP27DRAFT_1364600 [Rhodocollybia butyracea]|uniref:Uncharacterized protein n=1 Tax=Rhodocollybia butyracea TaxID=206335 RepID=A0A9P5PR00_9AGAR|nr:hypothetical protein BDP27DRAFT_1364600 [Rhodocollybia butyracea]